MSHHAVVAMGFQEDGWQSSWLHGEQLSTHLRAIAEGWNIDFFSPRCGHPPKWFDRRLRYRRQLPDCEIFHLVDPAYADSLPHARRRCRRAYVTVTDIAFWLFRRWYNVPFRKRIFTGLQSADGRIGISCKTADEMHHTLGLHCEHVVYLGSEPSLFSFNKEGRDEHQILHVGTTVPRKRLDRILHILAKLPSPFYLKQVGGKIDAKQQRLIADLGLKGRVEQVGFASRETLVKAYQSAGIFLFPSDYEGYGVPVVEARLTGLPVITSQDVPAIETLTQDDHTVALDFQRGEAFAQAADAIKNLKGRWSDLKGREYYSWQRVATEVLEIYRQGVHKS